MTRAARRRALRRALRTVGRLFLAGVVVTAVPLAFLRFVPPVTSAFMVRSHWMDPATGLPCETIHYRWVEREAIATDLALAVVVAEDQRFLDHHGLDFEAMRRALRERWRQGRVRGASTLTQQLAKNLFLWPDASYLRKAIEAWLAVSMETLWPKHRILELYLNVVQFGPCTFGAAAASTRYFDRPPSELAPDQAALLATVLPNPYKLRAHAPGPYAQARTLEILRLMAEHRWLRRRLWSETGP